jgi:hypothetical protein
MTSPSTTQDQPTAIAEIDRLGFTWKLEPQYDLSKLSVDRRVQVRELRHYAPKESVERFAIQMTQTPFPPIVVTRDHWVIDGNTRVGAKLLQKQDHFFPAIVLDVDYGAASRKAQNELHALAATLNCNGGVQLTSKEVREVAPRLIELGWKTEQIGRAIGLKSSSVTMVKKEIEAAERMRRVGLNPDGDPQHNGKSHGPSLRALGGKDVQTLTDVPFRELATLAAEAGLNAGEITATAKEALATGSEAGQIEKISGLRQELRDRIAQKALTGKGVPPVSRQLRQHLGFIAKFVGREQELVETDPNVSTLHIESLTAAVAVLNEVLRMQRI